MKRKLQLLGLVLVLLSITMLPVAGQEGDPAAGEDIYMTSCAACHGQDGSGSIPGTPDMTDSATWEQIPRAQHVDSVTNGVEGTQMPSFGDQLTEQEVQDVVAYERSLPEAGEEGGAAEEGASEGTQEASEEPGMEPAVTPVNSDLPGFTALTAVVGLLFIGVLGAVSSGRRRK